MLLQVIANEGEEPPCEGATLPRRQAIGIIEALGIHARKEIIWNARPKETVLVHSHDEAVALTRDETPYAACEEANHVAIAGRKGARLLPL